MCLEYNSVSYVLRSFFFQGVLNVQITAYLDLVSTRKGFFGLKDPCNCPVMGMFSPLFTTSSSKEKKRL